MTTIPAILIEIGELNALRKFADAIINLITKDQLKTLKSRLGFDPRKLPLTFDDLIQVVQQSADPKLEQLNARYFQLIDTFQTLISSKQREILRSYAEFVAQELEQCDDDYLYDGLELLSGLLLEFLENADND